MSDDPKDTTPLPDAAARRRIVSDLDTNLLVEAGAGSGKTTALIQRMVALIETGTARSEDITAVTFTRKAAGELRERFQTALERRINALQDSEDGSIESEDSAREGEPRLERLYTGLDEVNRTFIGTIHAFCARLLRERPLDVGLDPGFRELPASERDRLRRRHWEGFLERLIRDQDPILGDLRAVGLRPGELVRLYDELVNNPDVDYPAEQTSAPTPEEIEPFRREVEGLLQRGQPLMPADEPEKRWDDVQKKIRMMRATRYGTGWEPDAAFLDVLGQICQKTGEYRVTFNRWPADKEEVRALKHAFDEFAIGDTPARRLMHRWYAHRYALALRLARAAADDYAAYRKRTGQLDFQDLLMLTARLLRENPAARHELGLRYRRLLVDEFQDTDPVQAEIVTLLASEPESAPDSRVPEPGPDWRSAIPRPGALFVVGDPKQSIYRFRRADIQVYTWVKSRLAEVGDVLELTANFRSRPAIGALVNERFRGQGFFPEEATAEQASFAPLHPRRSSEGVPREGVFWYAIEPRVSRRDEIARDDARRLASWIRGRIERGERAPGDFLILTRVKRSLAVYARELEARQVPVQVSGAGVGVELELRELILLLECMIDPSDPVRVVAVLVGLFFGLDHEQLISHRLADGRFEIFRPPPRRDTEVESALVTLHQWWDVARREPADVFVRRLVAELGLLPHAASVELGSIRAGALIYALDAVRAAALAGDTSLKGALEALRDALDADEAEAPLEPGRRDVVRVMNLHQAKGLEGAVVVLAEPAGKGRGSSARHIERADDGRALGYLQVEEDSEGYGTKGILARPLEWEAKLERERCFDEAERVRLLYVAVTRAMDELVVARFPAKPESSPWEPLDAWLLREGQELDDVVPADPPPREEMDRPSSRLVADSEDARRATRAAADPTHRFVSVTQLTKGAGGGESRRDPPQPSPRSGDPGAESVGFRGYSWGTVVHGALAAVGEGVEGDELRSVCRALLIDNERPGTRSGEPTELRELLVLVDAVRDSDLWKRAMLSDHRLTEVPFAYKEVGVGRERVGRERAGPDASGAIVAGETLAQGDLFSPPVGIDVDDRPRGDGDAALPLDVVEGVIDLVFHEADGWVIADYKTDVGTDPLFQERLLQYRRQVDLYARSWTGLTGEPVKERVLFFTAQGRIENW